MIALIKTYNIRKQTAKSDKKWPRYKRFKKSFFRHLESNMAAKRSISETCDQDRQIPPSNLYSSLLQASYDVGSNERTNYCN